MHLGTLLCTWTLYCVPGCPVVHLLGYPEHCAPSGLSIVHLGTLLCIWTLYCVPGCPVVHLLGYPEHCAPGGLSIVHLGTLLCIWVPCTWTFFCTPGYPVVHLDSIVHLGSAPGRLWCDKIQISLETLNNHYSVLV